MASERTTNRLRQDAVNRAVLNRAKAPPLILRDGGGLLLKIGPRRASWWVEYRLPGLDPATGRRRLKKEMELGEYGPEFRLDAARKAAAEARAKVVTWIDVLVEQRAALHAQLDHNDGMTVAELAWDFVGEKAGGWTSESRAAFKGDFATIVAAIGPLRVKDITRRHLQRLLDRFVAEQQKQGD